LEKQREILIATSGMLALAQNVVDFNTTSAGTSKSIAQWVMEVVEDSSYDMQQSIANMAVNNISLISTNFFVGQPSQSNGAIATSDQAAVNTQFSTAALAGNKPLVMGPNFENTDRSIQSGSRVDQARWTAAIVATQNVLTSRRRAVGDGAPFNGSSAV
jgi:hypothetical protein